MSRSYKHNPIYKERATNREKRAFNKKTRKTLKDIDFDIGNGSYYKTIVESWEFHDYRFYYSKTQAVKRFHAYGAWNENTTEEDIIMNWQKDFYWK